MNKEIVEGLQKRMKELEIRANNVEERMEKTQENANATTNKFALLESKYDDTKEEMEYIKKELKKRDYRINHLLKYIEKLEKKN